MGRKAQKTVATCEFTASGFGNKILVGPACLSTTNHASSATNYSRYLLGTGVEFGSVMHASEQKKETMALTI
jgi:hypothetical protein